MLELVEILLFILFICFFGEILGVLFILAPFAILIVFIGMNIIYLLDVTIKFPNWLFLIDLFAIAIFLHHLTENYSEKKLEQNVSKKLKEMGY